MRCDHAFLANHSTQWVSIPLNITTHLFSLCSLPEKYLTLAYFRLPIERFSGQFPLYFACSLMYNKLIWRLRTLLGRSGEEQTLF